MLEYYLKKIITFLLLSLGLNTYSFCAEKFSVVVGLAKPPYVIQSSNSGFEIEMIKAILTQMSLEAEFIYVPYGRSVRMLQGNNIDAIMTVNNVLIEDKSLLSDTYINYQNIVVTLKENEIVINDLSDLGDLSIIAFQSANKILGEEFGNIVLKNQQYIEISNQFKQIKSLFDHQTNAVIMDINIFRRLSPLTGGKADYSDVDFHYIFDKSPYQLVFKNKAFIPLFNELLKKFKTSDDYLDLLKKYNLLQWEVAQ